MEMADMEEGIKTSRQRLMEIKSNIEYKAMLKEIAFKEDQRDQRETRLLESMDLMETQNRLIAEQIAQMEEQEAKPDEAAARKWPSRWQNRNRNWPNWRKSAKKCARSCPRP